MSSDGGGGGACPGYDFILRRNGFQIKINDDFLKRGRVMADNSKLTHSL